MASPHKETVGDEYAELVARVCVLRAGKGRLGEQDDARTIHGGMLCLRLPSGQDAGQLAE